MPVHLNGWKKTFHIGLEILIFQESRTGILISRSRLKVGYTIGAQGFLLTRIRQNAIPVRRGIHRRISPLRSGAEHHSLDGLFRAKGGARFGNLLKYEPGKTYKVEVELSVANRMVIVYVDGKTVGQRMFFAPVPAIESDVPHRSATDLSYGGYPGGLVWHSAECR